MKYTHIINGIFIGRPNRFIAHVSIDGISETVHVKNTGRCQELALAVEAGVQIIFLPCVAGYDSLEIRE